MTHSQITRLINWVAIVIALSLLMLVSYQLYSRHYIQGDTGQTYQFDDLPGAREAPVSADIEAIVNKHVFGVKPEVVRKVEPVVVKAAPKPAPKTRLDIKLTGIIDGTTPETGIAMLEVERGRTVVVAVGEQIEQTDAVLHQVLPGEVLIDREGTIESVKMVRKTLSVAKLESQLFDSLPQPYVGEHNDQQGASTNPVPRGKNTSSVDGGIPREEMKSLPIPRMLK